MPGVCPYVFNFLIEACDSSADRSGMERQEGRPITQTSTSATSDTPLPIPANFKVSTSVDAEIPAVAESYPNGSKDICLLKKPVKNYKSTDNLIGGTYYFPTFIISIWNF